MLAINISWLLSFLLSVFILYLVILNFILGCIIRFIGNNQYIMKFHNLPTAAAFRAGNKPHTHVSYTGLKSNYSDQNIAIDSWIDEPAMISRKHANSEM